MLTDDLGPIEPLINKPDFANFSVKPSTGNEIAEVINIKSTALKKAIGLLVERNTHRKNNDEKARKLSVDKYKELIIECSSKFDEYNMKGFLAEVATARALLSIEGAIILDIPANADREGIDLLVRLPNIGPKGEPGIVMIQVKSKESYNSLNGDNIKVLYSAKAEKRQLRKPFTHMKHTPQNTTQKYKNLFAEYARKIEDNDNVVGIIVNLKNSDFNKWGVPTNSALGNEILARVKAEFYDEYNPDRF